MKIQKVTKKSYPTGDQLVIKADEGRFTCKDASIFDTLIASEGQEMDVEVDGSLITAVSSNVEESPFPEKDKEETPKDEASKTVKSKEKVEQTPEVNPKESDEISKESDENSKESDEIPDEPQIAQKTEGLSSEDSFEPNTLFPLLRADEIEVRIGQLSDKYLTLLLYKNARCDQERLDAQYTPLGWQTSYQVLDGQLFCTVSVRNPETGEWVSKTDVGTPSNTEAEKGRVSDAFKRACVCWGSGRELYSSPEIKIYADKTQIKTNNKGKLVCYDKFVVKSIAYDDKRRISKLEIYGAYAKGIVFRFGK